MKGRPLWAPRSLLGQIGTVHAATLLLLGLGLPTAAVLTVRHTAARFQRQLLVRQLEEVRAGLHADGGTWRVRLPQPLAGLYAQGYDGLAYAVVSRSGHVLAASDYATPAMVAAAPRLDRPRGFGVGPIRGRAAPLGPAGVPGWLIVAQDISDPRVVTDDVLRESLLLFLWWLVPALALVPLATAFLIRRSMAAVRRLSLRAAEIGPASLDVRLPIARLPSEVVPLAAATNMALDRLAEGFRAQSEFVANVAHELRTPLATLRLRTDAIEDASLARAMRATLDQAAHVVTQMLDLASLERLSIGEEERFDLGEAGRAALEEAAPTLYAGGRSASLIAPEHPVVVHGRAGLIALVVANLLDNAQRHTPAGTHVELRVDETGLLAVADDGPGAREAGLTERFRRGAGAGAGGAGIGLSIVRRILLAHGGDLAIGDSDRGGARFAFRLRLA